MIERLKVKNVNIIRIVILLVPFVSFSISFLFFFLMLTSLGNNADFWFEAIKVSVGIFVISFAMCKFYLTYYNIFEEQSSNVPIEIIHNLRGMHKSKKFENLLLLHDMSRAIFYYECFLVIYQFFYNIYCLNPLMEGMEFYLIYSLVSLLLLFITRIMISKKRKELLYE